MKSSFNVAIIGGGSFCSSILDIFSKNKKGKTNFRIVGIAETDPSCIQKARESNIFITDDFREILNLKDLDIIVELTGDPRIREEISKNKLDNVKIIDRISAEIFSEMARLESTKSLKGHWNKKIKAVSRLFADIILLEQEKISMAREMENRLKAERDYTTNIFDHLPDSVLVLNKDMDVERANNTFIHEFGYDGTRIEGKKCYELIYNRNEQCPSSECPISLLKEQRGNESRKEISIKKDGNVLYYEAYLSPFFDHKNRVKRYLYKLTNITRRKQLEQELEKSRQKYIKLFQDARDGIIFFKENGEIIESNLSLCKMLNYSFDEINKMRVGDLAHGISKKILSDHLEDLKTMVYVAVEFDFCRKDGQIIPVEASLLYIMDEGIFQAMVRDITARKKLEDAQKQYAQELEKEVEKRTYELRESQKEILKQKKYAEGIIYGSPIPMFVLDKNHKITYWNKACEKLTGFSAREMIGTDNQWKPFYPHKRPLLADLVIEGNIKEIHRLYKSMNLRKSPMVEGAYEAEHYFPHLGTEGTHLYFNAAPIKDEKGEIQGAIVTYQDFSERVRMTQELKKRETFVRNLIENSIDGIIATDEKGKIVIFNRSASEMLGFSPKEIMGKITYIEILSREMTRKIRTCFYSDQFGPKGKIINMEAELINKSGEPIPVRLSGTLLFEKRKEVGSVVFIQDLREILKLQKEKEQAQRMALIGQTVAGLAHYIKNILNGLKGGSYVMQSALNKQDVELMEKGLKMMNKNIDQITNIVMDMLIYSKERRPAYEPVDPNELTMDVVELMEERARLANVKLNTQLQSNLQPVNMDRTAIHRCLLNLINNAIDACSLKGIMEGKGIVTVKTYKPDGWAVGFDVIDNGTGMDEETQKKLFTGFFSTKGYKGTGLGLPVTQKIVKEHGGELKFVSKPGKGTTFTLLLPDKSK